MLLSCHQYRDSYTDLAYCYITRRFSPGECIAKLQLDPYVRIVGCSDSFIGVTMLSAMEFCCNNKEQMITPMPATMDAAANETTSDLRTGSSILSAIDAFTALHQEETHVNLGRGISIGVTPSNSTFLAGLAAIGVNLSNSSQAAIASLTSVGVNLLNTDSMNGIATMAFSGVTPPGSVWIDPKWRNDTYIEDQVPITSIRINAPPAVIVKRGETYKYNLILNKGASDRSIIWSTSNPAVATVDNYGNVTIMNMPGAVVLLATDAISGCAHSIILRVS